MISKTKKYIIVGYGRIGRRLTKLLLEEDAKVIVVDPFIDGLGIEHPNLEFLKMSSTEQGFFEKFGNINEIAAFVLVAGRFSANASMLFKIEKTYHTEGKDEFDYMVIIRARNFEEKDILINYATKSKEEMYIVYAEEAGADTVAAELGILIRKKLGERMNELKIISNQDISSEFIDINIFLDDLHIDVISEHYHFDTLQQRHEFRSIIGPISDGKRLKVNERLINYNNQWDYSLRLLSSDELQKLDVVAYDGSVK